MAITRIGATISVSPNFDDPSDKDVIVNGGEFGLNSIPVGGLQEGTQYYAKAWFEQDGMITTSNISRFSTKVRGDQRFRFENDGASAVSFEISSFTNSNWSAPNITLSYSSDGSTWNTWDSSVSPYQFEYTIPAGGVLYLKGDNTTLSTGTAGGNFACWRFWSDGDLYCYGNIMYLLDSTGQSVSLGTNGKFIQLFSNMGAHLLSAPDLPATTLANSCYYQMFWECSSLSVAPELPATVLANSCYYQIFRGCTSLTVAPELPATVLASNCYYGMFQGCRSLSYQPALIATVLAAGCYGFMFSGCSRITRAQLPAVTSLERACYQGMYSGTSITVAPELPATRLAEWCYSEMFKDCTHLLEVPNLPASRLESYCYYSMFGGCTGLTSIPANLLPNTRLFLACYSMMFKGCTGLTSIPSGLLPATDLTDANSCYYQMFMNCSNLSQVPSGLLPATTLSMSCYESMFENSGITVAPDLPAATLYTDCYKSMFKSCTNLNKITVYATSWNTSYANQWVRYVSSTGDFYNLGGATIASGFNGIPSGWTVHTSL